MVCNTFLIIPLEGLTWNKMCLPEKHVTLRESKLLVQYAFHTEVRKNATRSNIEITNNILFCFSMIYCAFLFSKVTQDKQRICIHKEVVKHINWC